jgi:hypothetical protein
MQTTWVHFEEQVRETKLLVMDNKSHLNFTIICDPIDLDQVLDVGDSLLAKPNSEFVSWQFTLCCKPLINVPYIRTFGVPDQGQMLDVRESQTAKSALRDYWTRNVPRHTLKVVLEVILEHMCIG